MRNDITIIEELCEVVTELFSVHLKYTESERFKKKLISSCLTKIFDRLIERKVYAYFRSTVLALMICLCMKRKTREFFI